jgi:hypothetical protein
LKTSSSSSKKYAKVHEKVPKLKIQAPKEISIHKTQDPDKTQLKFQIIKARTYEIKKAQVGLPPVPFIM